MERSTAFLRGERQLPVREREKKKLEAKKTNPLENLKKFLFPALY
jgi:hypothetical protein